MRCRLVTFLFWQHWRGTHEVDLPQADFLLTPLRCPASWEQLLSDLNQAEALLSSGAAPEARQLLGQAVTRALGSGAESLHRALEDCAVGLGAAFRLLAMSHYGDPIVREAEAEVQIAALEVALRMQHLASGWLIYAYNVAARHQDSFIDGSAWPIRSNEFGDEHRSVAALLGKLRAELPAATRPDVKPSTRARGLPLSIVTICDYPEDALLPKLAAFVHGMYAHRHGYGYIHHRDPHHAQGAEGKEWTWQLAEM